MEIQVNEFQNWKAQDPTDVEVWYHCLEKETFRTAFVPLPYNYAQVLIRYYDKTSTEDDKIILSELTKSIDDIIKSFPNPVAFVRLSTLSPKDATKSQVQKLIDLMQTLLRKVNRADESEQIRVVNKALFLASQVTSGTEAMELFRLSERAAKHLRHRTSITEPENWNMNIIVREWNNIDPEWEFRCFIYGKQLTAISHYYKILYVPEITAAKDKIKKLIFNYFENTLRELIPLENYILDLVIDIKTSEVKVIELNPWLEASSPSLFNWTDDRDILYGEKPFEIRVLNEPFKVPRDNLSLHLQVILDTAKKALDDEKKSKTGKLQTFIKNLF